MICLQCQFNYERQFDSDFVNGICFPCQSQNDAEVLELQWSAELEVYAQRTGFELDFNEFCCYAEAGEVNRVNLFGLPGLQDAYDWEMANMKFYEAEEYRYQSNQLSLFENAPSTETKCGLISKKIKSSSCGQWSPDEGS